MNNKREEKYALILAALLHDIGKFAWRSRKLEAGINHELLSEQIFTEYLASKKCILPLKEEILENIQHHTNRKYSSIMMADSLDAEAERESEANKNARRPIISILSRINLNEANQPQSAGTFYYEPKMLNPKDIFAKNAGQDSIKDWSAFTEEQIEKHKALLDQFLGELKNLPENDLPSLVDSLLFLYEKYLPYVSSAGYKSTPDVSLYDHCKVVSALCACIEYTDDDEKPYLIIAADVTGIQRFLYTESGPQSGSSTESKSKRLRGKSFFVSLLTDLFSTYLLNEFDLPRTNILMNGGGTFIILAPNSNENREKFVQLRKSIQLWFYNNFKGDINLILESLEADDGLYKNFNDWHTIISSSLLRAKRQKSIDIIEEVFNSDFDKAQFGRFQSQLNKQQSSELSKFTNEYERNLFLLASVYENLGEVLPKSEYLVQINGDRDRIDAINNENKLFISLSEFNIGYLFINSAKELEQFLHNTDTSGYELIRITKINNIEFLPSAKSNLLSLIKHKDLPASFGFILLGNYAPIDENGGIMEFQDLAASDEKNNTKLEYNLMAVLRMDVDNLGSIFSIGLERDSNSENIKTLSRTVALSREFNLFFSGYLNQLAEKWKIYIVYSGGDDLLVSGSWINIIHFAMEVKSDFKRFACGNPDVTISAGVTFNKPSYPIGRAAQLSGDAEKRAKNRFRDKKNCISILGREYTWADFEKYLNYGHELDELVEAEEIKSSYLYYLLGQSQQMLNENGMIDSETYFSLIGKIKYYLAREPRKITAGELEKLNNGEHVPKKVEVLSKLVNKIDSQDYLENLVVPASYVILRHRK